MTDAYEYIKTAGGIEEVIIIIIIYYVIKINLINKFIKKKKGKKLWSL